MSDPADAPSPADLRRLLDRRALYDLALRYARCADRRDFEGFRAIFTPEVHIAGYTGDPADGSEPRFDMRGIEVALAGMKGLERYELTTHLVANQLVEFEAGGRTAGGETYCLAHHLYRDGDDGPRMNYTMSIRYQDRFARGPDGWRFSERILVVDWERTAPLEPAS